LTPERRRAKTRAVRRRRTSSSRSIAAAIFVASGSAASPAFALDTWDGDFDAPPAKVRSDFMAGLSGGLLLGSASGFPNEAGKVGDPDFEAGTGFGLGTGGTLWIGGALHDAFTVGIGQTGGAISGNSVQGQGGAFVLRLEGYPLFGAGGVWENIGLSASFGAGAFQLKDAEDEDEDLADGGLMSFVGGGVLWEALRFGPVAMGPSLEYLYLYSESLEGHTAGLFWRTVFYGGP
jgi:hypothetical protein